MNFLPLLVLLTTLMSATAFAQNSSAGTSAAQLPLSGKSTQGGSVSSAQAPVSGVTNSVNTINPTISVQGPYTGSIDSTQQIPFTGTLSLSEALRRGLDYNLGSVGLNQSVRQARGQVRVARSALLPNLTSSLREVVQQTNLAAQGLRISAPGFSIPEVVGPFNYYDLRATLTQSIVDLTALNNYRAAKESARANEHAARDARDLVVLAVGGAYLQTQAARARVETARAQLETAKALYEQTVQRRQVGLVPQIDVNRSLVERQTQEQRISTLENDYAKQKINLARLTGLPPNPNFDVAGQLPYSAAMSVTVEDALRDALDRREDLKAAAAQIRAAERALSAARAERLPSLSLSADYGSIGTNPARSHGTFTVIGTLRMPLWQGGRTEGNIEQASAVLAQRRAEMADVRSRVESEIRGALLDLEAATNQLTIARRNEEVAAETLGLIRQRFEAGIADTVEVVQAQESVAGAKLDYITSLFAHNLAKLSLARARGHAEVTIAQDLGNN